MKSISASKSLVALLHRQTFRLALLILLITGGLALISQTTIWRLWELTGFDLLTTASAPSAFPELPIIVVGIDEPSFADINEQWPWPRRYHARLIDELTRGGASVIAFDVVFANASTEKDDQLLATAIANSRSVVLAGDLVLQQRDQFEQLMRIEPLHRLQQAGALTGIAAITPDNDQVVRTIPSHDDALWRVIAQSYQRQTGLKVATTRPSAAARLRYFGPDHSFKYVSYYQVLDADKLLPPGIFRDKIVIVGYDVKASAQPGATHADAFPSPFMRTTGWLTPGVEIQATFVADALLGRHLTEAPHHYTLLATLLALLLTLPGMVRWDPLRSGATMVLVLGIMLVLDWYLFSWLDVWLPLLPAIIAPVLLFIAQGGSAFLHERNRRQQIRNAFQHYVSPEVVEEMTQNPANLKLGGELRTITLLFTDLEGFTHISEGMGPTAVAHFLNDYFTDMTRIILDYGGTVDKFIGDAVMAFWGAPLNDEQQALHATRAAIDMQRAMEQLRNNITGDAAPKVRMRIGIHTGEAIVGNMGSLSRFNYTALGDTVNLASRLEGVNKQYDTSILLSETTAGQLHDEIPLLYVDRVVVKGKSVPITIYTPIEDNTVYTLAEQAKQAYLDQQWDEAEQLWQELGNHTVTATLSAIYRERIAHYRQHPPADGWDGRAVLDSK